MPHTWPVPHAGPLDATTGAQRDGIIIPSAAYGTGATTSPEYANYKAKGLLLYIDITNANGGNVTVKVQSKDPASGNWVDFPLATTTALASNATTTLSIYPGQTESANVDVADPLGVSWRVVATVAAATMTFSVGGVYLG